MKGKHIILSIGLALALGLVQVSAALAVEPVPFSESGSGSAPFDCGKFQLLEEWTFYGEGRTYLDQDGLPLRSWVKETISERFSRPGTDLELSGASTMSGFYYYNEAGEITLARAEGTYFVLRIPVPGHGLILRNVGLLVADYENGTFYWHGNWDWYDGDVEALCAYFAGE